ncbi:MAG: histidinol dehydrogenase [Deltaproteobacteria bacterium]|nr:histidinol dehydrogenase [Deltaproteobacteria bacterium]
MTTVLRRVSAKALPDLRRDPVSLATVDATRPIVTDVAERGESALRYHAERFGDIAEGAPLVIARPELDAALAALPAADRALLERTAARIRAFAEAQRGALGDVTVAIPGGRAGHTVAPVERAGCYAPGGRFPLPSSVLMTAVTARAAGVELVWVASPKPTAMTLAAAAVAGADALLACGGAQAIAALAYGAGPVPACDVIVGPGNRYVTAAKQIVSGRVRIDMLAGPSELVVLADHTADADVVAADLLGQAEHDPDAVPVLVTTDAGLAERVNDALVRQLATLPTAETARAAVENGFCVVALDLDEAVRVCDQLAPEHLEVMTANADTLAGRLRHYGGLFVGAGAAEVFGDYGAGPNHVLPTGGTARLSGGLSVFDFLRVRTWLAIDDAAGAAGLVADAADLARHEGLEAHARAALARHRGVEES